MPLEERGLELSQLQSYKGVLWTACQKAVETAKALHNDLERLDNEHVEEGHNSIARIEVATGPSWEVAQGSGQGTSLETNQEVK